MHILQRPRIICDFETYSELDVRDVGAWRYAEHPSTEILMLSHGYAGKKKSLWMPGMPFPQYIIDHINAGYPIEAHNCMFERAIWFHVLSVQFGVPNPKCWIDTLASCAYRGLPLGLDDVGEVLDLDVKKDKEGKGLIQKLCKPRKPTKKDPSTRNRDPDLIAKLGSYCVRDSEAEDSLGHTIGDLPPMEFSTWVMDQRINYRGVMVDLEAVDAAIWLAEEISMKLQEELVFITEGAVKSGSEVAKILKWLQANGIQAIDNLQAGTVDAYLEQNAEVFKRTGKNWLPDDTVRVLQIRQQLSKASTKKLIKFKECANADGRIRGLLQYHGAGTGRWAGRLVQPQNFPRGSIEYQVGWKADGKKEMMGGADLMEFMIRVIKLRDVEMLEYFFGDPMSVISSALRGMFIASPGKTFYVADFSAIEARVVMWLAGQTDALEAFYSFDKGIGPDIYCVTAAKIYGRPIDKKKDPDERQLGKITVLGCGYQMSGARLQEQARDSYGVEITIEMANKMVATFRGDYDQVPLLWRGLEDAAADCIRLKQSTIYTSRNGVSIKFEYVRDKAGTWLAMVLPSGRRLWYYNPGLEKREIEYIDKESGETKKFTKDSIHYEGRDNKKGGSWGRVFTYGGMLTENAVQAIARDLMVAAMIRVEKEGYSVVLSVHDELVAEDAPDRDIKAFEALVSGPNPDWAKGCPVAAEGWKGTRYRK